MADLPSSLSGGSKLDPYRQNKIKRQWWRARISLFNVITIPYKGFHIMYSIMGERNSSKVTVWIGLFLILLWNRKVYVLFLVTSTFLFPLLSSLEVFSTSLRIWKLKYYLFKIIKLPIVLYGCETFIKGRTFENIILTPIFRPKKDENVDWRRLHNEEFHRSPHIIRMNKSRRLRLAGHVARIEKGRSALKF